MKKFIVSQVLTTILLTQITIFNVNGQNQDNAPKPKVVNTVKKWLSKNAVVLKSVRAGNGFSDLKPLKKILKDVRIIGIGEATHGTSEFFHFKHRMIEFLVEEMNFNVITLEASYPACLKINEYVLYGKGNRMEALAGQGFWTWNTEEISSLIEWVYQKNKTRPEKNKVKFVGFDMQNYNHGFEKVESFLKKVAPDYLERILANGLPDKLTINKFRKKSSENKKKLKRQIKDVVTFISSKRNNFVNQTSRQEFEEALFSANIWLQFADMFSRPPFNTKNVLEGAVAKRDFFMAKNIKRIFNLSGKNTRMVVLAHNSHISADNLGVKLTAMGKYLRQTYGKNYYALGLTFGNGAFQAVNTDRKDPNKGLIEFKIGSPQRGYVDWYFGLPSLKNYFVDFRHTSKPQLVKEWLNTKYTMRSIGSGFSSKMGWWGYTEPTVLKERFDGMVFIRHMTRAHPIRKK